jgi:hypothetical protein
MKHNKCSSLWLCVLVILAGCASSNIRSRQEYMGEKIARPDHIIVHDFTASASDNPGYTPEQMETGRKLGAEVAGNLVAEIRQLGLAAERAGAITPQAGDLVIKGHFVTIEQGNAGERVMVGLGSGAAELKTVVEGYQMTDHGLRRLGSGEADSQGGKTPGLLVGVATFAATGNPIGLIVGGASKLVGENKGTETIAGAAQRTAKEIAEALQVKFQQQGWI